MQFISSTFFSIFIPSQPIVLFFSACFSLQPQTQFILEDGSHVFPLSELSTDNDQRQIIINGQLVTILDEDVSRPS